MKTPTGYSTTPLAKKLGITSGTHILTRSAPDDYLALIDPLPDKVVFDTRLSKGTDLIHLFATSKTVLAKELAALRKSMRTDAIIWVSWPKKASNVETDITEDVIREIALPMGLVDVKVCAVTDVWSGLKLCIRKELR
jgi:hypothetical protein